MRKIIVLSYLTMDGFTGSKDGSSDWIVWDDGVNDYYKETQRTADAVLFGRATYEPFKAYWGTSKSSSEDREMVDYINQVRKIVFSRSLKTADWNNAEVVNEISPDKIKAMKQEPGKNILVMGSGSVVSQLENAGLIDEYRFISLPVILGEGKPYFTDLDNVLQLKLIETRKFDCGSILHRYQARAED
jgi:dihydrofolate reductase